MNRLRELRVVKRITQFQLTLLTGIGQSKISMVENDLLSPTEDEKKRLAEVLGVKVRKIWKGNSA